MRWMPVFPTVRTSFDRETNVLKIDDNQFAVGNEVVLGGSGAPLADLPNVQWATEPDDSCDSTYIWSVGLFN